MIIIVLEKSYPGSCCHQLTITSKTCRRTLKISDAPLPRQRVRQNKVCCAPSPSKPLPLHSLHSLEVLLRRLAAPPCTTISKRMSADLHHQRDFRPRLISSVFPTPVGPRNIKGANRPLTAAIPDWFPVGYWLILKSPRPANHTFMQVLSKLVYFLASV